MSEFEWKLNSLVHILIIKNTVCWEKTRSFQLSLAPIRDQSLKPSPAQTRGFEPKLAGKGAVRSLKCASLCATESISPSGRRSLEFGVLAVTKRTQRRDPLRPRRQRAAAHSSKNRKGKEKRKTRLLASVEDLKRLFLTAGRRKRRICSWSYAEKEPKFNFYAQRRDLAQRPD